MLFFYIPLLLFFVAVVIQLAFGFFFSIQPATSSDKAIPEAPLGVSIIICAKNESENLKRFLPAVLQQDYPDGFWEILVVNDASADDSSRVLAAFKEEYPRLRVIHLIPGECRQLPGKKYALDKGMAAAKYETVLLTDADCRPVSEQWLKTFAAAKLRSGKPIILGYGAYQALPGLLNKFIRWETLHTAMQYFSFARVGKPYMGVGRNLMYERACYGEAKNDFGFWRKYQKTPSGDDDVLLSHIAHKENTAYCLDEKANTVSRPQASWKNWWRQKTRHVATGKYYRPEIQFLLALFAISHALFWFLGLGLIAFSFFYGTEMLQTALLLLFGWRLSLYWINAANWQKTLHEKKLLFFYPAGDFGWAVYNVILSPYIFWKSRTTWK